MKENDATGLRYYDTAPYLLVQKGPGGDWISQLLYLPDQTKMNQICSWTLMGVNTDTFSFTNSILTDASAETDTTAVPAAVIAAAAAFVKGAIKTFALAEPTELVGPKPDKAKPEVYLFKITSFKGGLQVVAAGAPPLPARAPK